MSEISFRSSIRRGRTLKLYLVDGTPSGVITAEFGVSSVRMRQPFVQVSKDRS